MYLTDGQQLKKTALYEMHIAAKAKMVVFAGYNMPLHYSTGIMLEHNQTRDAASLFDVSHMGQIILSGSGIGEALEKLIPLDLQSMAIYQQKYGVMTNVEGGIVDDLVIARWAEDTYFLVVNAKTNHTRQNHKKHKKPK